MYGIVCEIVFVSTYEMFVLVELVILAAFTVEVIYANPARDYIMAYIPVDELPNLAAMNIEVIPIPYYQNPYLYDPWYYQSLMMGNLWSPYPQTTGPVHFGGQVEGRGGVSIKGEFGNDGYNKVTSYSAPPTPVVVTPKPTLPLPDSDWPNDSILPNANVPKITSLPEIAYPYSKSNEMTDTPLPVTKISMPDKDVPIIMALSSMTEESFIELRNLGYIDDDEEFGPVVFGGKVPASGRVRISANF